jgi:hypothetical protein
LDRLKSGNLCVQLDLQRVSPGNGRAFNKGDGGIEDMNIGSCQLFLLRNIKAFTTFSTNTMSIYSKSPVMILILSKSPVMILILLQIPSDDSSCLRTSDSVSLSSGNGLKGGTFP